jgi:hypothetical protein
MRLALTLIAALAPALSQGQEQTQCAAVTSEVTLATLSGHRIDSVFIETAHPSLGRLAHIAGRMHVRTRPEVIRRELLFAPGDTVDTLLVAESMRRLRKLPFLQYAHVEARQCPASSGESLALTVVTRDSWTARPDLKTGRKAAGLGVTERNLFGTGRSVSLDLVSRNRSLGAGIAASDAFGFGSGVRTRVQYQQYSDGFGRELSLARRQTSLADRWRARLDLLDQRHDPATPLSEHFDRTSGELLGGVRINSSEASHVVYLLAGAESEHSALVAAPNTQVLGPVRVDRRFTGPEIGFSVLAARYDTLTWLLPGGALIDVPRTLEGEIVVGVGPGTVTGRDSTGPVERSRSDFMTRYDAWIGREWLPTQTMRVVGDVWASGYSGSGDWYSGHTRAAISAERAASHGIWHLTGAAEQLTDPDPDIRALSIFDRALPFVPSRLRLAESALTLSLERTRHLRPLGSTFELDGSVFGAISRRWDSAPSSSSSDDFSVSVVGLGIALTPRRAGGSTLRLDCGIPVTASPGVRRVPRLSITLLPWLEAGRHRDKTGSF